MSQSSPPNPMESSRENPMTMDEEATRVDPLKPLTDERPSELESRLQELENQDVTAPGTTGPNAPDWPVPTAQDQDEGPLGEGGQLREGSAGGGGGSGA